MTVPKMCRQERFPVSTYRRFDGTSMRGLTCMRALIFRWDLGGAWLPEEILHLWGFLIRSLHDKIGLATLLVYAGIACTTMVT